MVTVGLVVILGVVLFAPFLSKKIEQDLEIFLFVMGCLAVTITAQWSGHLVREALTEPLKITLAVGVAGFLFLKSEKWVHGQLTWIIEALGLKLFSFLLIVFLGILSSVITAIIAALILAEVISVLRLEKKKEIFLVILTCFSIGLGAALTPIGEPLSTITIAKLKGAPYHADFFFLLKLLGPYIVSGVILVGVLGAVVMPNRQGRSPGLTEDRVEESRDLWARTGKVYLFVMALIFLGQGFKPIIDGYVVKIPYQGLYWLNGVSAVLDNATLAAAEIGPAMGFLQLKSALIGLLIAGGMLIPGNIPNIISAGKLKITSTEWAQVGVPVGLALMGVYFFLLMVFQ